MSKSSFAIITPSYAPDFERCRLLSWSISQFISSDVTHYIIVDRRDLQLFSQLKKPGTEIITVESVIPWWIQRIPGLKNGWLSLKTIPIRNWIIQQIVKIGIAEHVRENILVFVDSDTAFFRPFNLESFIQSGQIRLFREPSIDTQETHLKWHRTAHKLLGLPFVDASAPDYIGNVITWKRENLLKLHQHIAAIAGRNWVEVVASSWHLSEYVLYGVFVEHILQEESGHYFDDKKICHEYWSPTPMSDTDLHNFFTDIHSEQVAIMISAKAGISVQQYEKLFNLSTLN